MTWVSIQGVSFSLSFMSLFFLASCVDRTTLKKTFHLWFCGERRNIRQSSYSHIPLTHSRGCNKFPVHMEEELKKLSVNTEFNTPSFLGQYHMEEEFKKLRVDSELNKLSFLEYASAAMDPDISHSSSVTNRIYAPLINNEEFATERLKQELVIMKADPFTHCCCGPDGDDIFNWQAAIMGPPGTPVEDGVYFLSIKIPEDYPFSPPKVKFLTKVYHPSIDGDGNIYVDILEDRWTPAMTIMTLLMSIWSILPDPTIIDPFGPLADLDSVERKNYNKKAREWTFKYAMG